MDEISIGIAGSGIMGLENMGSVDAMAGTRIAVVADQPGSSRDAAEGITVGVRPAYPSEVL